MKTGEKRGKERKQDKTRQEKRTEQGPVVSTAD